MGHKMSRFSRICIYFFTGAISTFALMKWFCPGDDRWYDLHYTRWYGYMKTYNADTGTWTGTNTPLSNTEIFGRYFDMMTIYIANRTSSIPFFAFLTLWKNGE